MTESDTDFEMLESRLSQLTPDERILASLPLVICCIMAFGQCLPPLSQLLCWPKDTSSACTGTNLCKQAYLTLPLCPPRRRGTRCRLQVSSAFSQLLALHNLTEETITARVEKAQRIGEVGCYCTATTQTAGLKSLRRSAPAGLPVVPRRLPHLLRT